MRTSLGPRFFDKFNRNHIIQAMTYFFIILLIVLMLAALVSQVLSIPGNWIILLLLGLWKGVGSDSPELTGQVFLIMALMAAAGEGLEWGAQLWSGKRYGSSGFGNVGGILGAIVGAILGMPILFGLGALLGAMAGAYIGCLVVELMRGRPGAEARQAALGVFWGKLFGLCIKLGIGASIIWIGISHVWPA